MADLTAQNKWEPLATDNSDREKIWSKSRTFAGDVWFRFRRKPTAIAGFVIIIALTLFALVGPLFTPYDYSVQNLEVVNVPPVMKVYQIPNGDYLYITTALKVISVTPDGKLSGQLRKAEYAGLSGCAYQRGILAAWTGRVRIIRRCIVRHPEPGDRVYLSGL